ncbi:MAG: molybdate ABC transporter substrate-binding protein [Rhodothermales bacterium]|nr:molybdate ABC transporter substrate-binding protein [Rhodothermales bacterium]
MPCVTILLVSLSVSCRQAPDKESVVLFAASSLTDVADSLHQRLAVRYPDTDFAVHVAGSSLLARQIESGAKFDIYLSANSSWMTRLDQKNMLLRFDTLRYTNSLVLVGTDLDATHGASEVLDSAERLGVGDPDHVPAGIYARESLTCMNKWAEVKDRLIPMLDVRSVIVAVSNGSVDAGIVYSTDGMATDLDQLPMDHDCQPDITYTIGASRRSGALTLAVYDYLAGRGDAAVWAHYGFIERQ